jgi:hypothetical protein
MATTTQTSLTNGEKSSSKRLEEQLKQPYDIDPPTSSLFSFFSPGFLDRLWFKVSNQQMLPTCFLGLWWSA